MKEKRDWGCKERLRVACPCGTMVEESAEHLEGIEDKLDRLVIRWNHLQRRP